MKDFVSGMNKLGLISNLESIKNSMPMFFLVLKVQKSRTILENKVHLKLSLLYEVTLVISQIAKP